MNIQSDTQILQNLIARLGNHCHPGILCNDHDVAMPMYYIGYGAMYSMIPMSS